MPESLQSHPTGTRNGWKRRAASERERTMLESFPKSRYENLNYCPKESMGRARRSLRGRRWKFWISLKVIPDGLSIRACCEYYEQIMKSDLEVWAGRGRRNRVPISTITIFAENNAHSQLKMYCTKVLQIWWRFMICTDTTTAYMNWPLIRISAALALFFHCISNVWTLLPPIVNELLFAFAFCSVKFLEGVPVDFSCAGFLYVHLFFSPSWWVY